MRILFHHRTRRKGAEGIHIDSIMSALRTRGHDVVEVSLVSGDGVARHLRRSIGSLRRAGGVALRPVLRNRLCYELGEMVYPQVIQRTLLKACAGHQPDIIYDRYNLYNDAGIRLGERLDIPVIVEVNTPYALERAEYNLLDNKLVFRQRALQHEVGVFKRANALVTVTGALKDYLVSQGIDPRKVNVVHNGVDLALFNPQRAGRHAEQLRRVLNPAGDQLVGFVGSLARSHRLGLLVDAMAQVVEARPRTRALLVGDGVERERLQAMAQERGLGQQFVFVGEVPHADIPAYLALFDIAVKPHSLFWSCPMKLFEYMALGKPIVAPDIAAIREIVRDRQEALLVRPGSPEALARAILAFLDDPHLARTIGAAARKRVVWEGQWTHAAAKIEGVAQKLVAAQNRSSG